MMPLLRSYCDHPLVCALLAFISGEHLGGFFQETRALF